MFNLFKKSKEQDPIEHGANAVRFASRAAKLVPFQYLLGNSSNGSVSFKQYTGMFIEQNKVHILSEKERAAIADLLTNMRNTPR